MQSALCVPGMENSQHFVLELSAAHANEIGSLMIVLLAMPAANVSLEKHAASLRSVGMLLEKRRMARALTVPPQSRLAL